MYVECNVYKRKEERTLLEDNIHVSSINKVKHVFWKNNHLTSWNGMTLGFCNTEDLPL